MYDIVLMCIDCVLASPRIVQVDPGDEPLPRWFYHKFVANRLLRSIHFQACFILLRIKPISHVFGAFVFVLIY
jgi:hypothetical protein